MDKSYALFHSSVAEKKFVRLKSRINLDKAVYTTHLHTAMTFVLSTQGLDADAVTWFYTLQWLLTGLNCGEKNLTH